MLAVLVCRRQALHTRLTPCPVWVPHNMATGCYFPRSCAEYSSCMKDNHDRVVGTCCIGWVILVIMMVFFVF